MASRDHAPSILIVDRAMSCGWRLRNSLLASGATVHVFHAFEPALRLLRAKRIDTAVIAFDADEATLEFCREATARSITLVFTPRPGATIPAKVPVQLPFLSASPGFSPSSDQVIRPNDLSTARQ